MSSMFLGKYAFDGIMVSTSHKLGLKDKGKKTYIFLYLKFKGFGI